MNILLKSLTFQGHCENFQNKKLNVMSIFKTSRFIQKW